MIWKVSSGCSSRRARSTAALACSIGLAGHAARAVEHEDHLQRLALQRCQVLGRVEHQREEAAALVAVGQQADLIVLAGHLVAQHEVLVGNACPAGSSCTVGRLRRRLLRRRSTWLRQSISSMATPASMSTDSAMSWPLRSPGLRYWTSVVWPETPRAAAADRADAVGAARRVEPRADDHREDELVPAVGVGQRVEVADVDVDLLARLDVGDRLGEDVRPLLGQQRGDVALALGLLVDLLGLLALADDAADLPLADGHDELVDRRVVRQREDVDRLDLARRRGCGTAG